MRVRHWNKNAIVAFVFLAIMLPATPVAVAHDCASHDPHECDATSCVDGEDHNHVDYNDDEEDYRCRSEKPVREDGCEYYNVRWPTMVCDLLRDDFELPF